MILSNGALSDPNTTEPPIVWSTISGRGYLIIDALAKHERRSPLLVAELRRVIRAAASVALVGDSVRSTSVLRINEPGTVAIVEDKTVIMVPFVVWQAAVIAVCAPAWAASIVRSDIYRQRRRQARLNAELTVRHGAGGRPMSGDSVTADPDADLAVREAVARSFEAMVQTPSEWPSAPRVQTPSEVT